MFSFDDVVPSLKRGGRKAVQLLDKGEGKAKAAGTAMDKFKTLTAMGAEEVDQSLDTRHQNTITYE